jgi:F0F1-type ATP synthase membrane subunit c/vacuolar-type H+-ATPase subunit K
MKNAVASGLIIGILSGLWLFIMRWSGYTMLGDQVSPIEYISILIPILGVFLGLKSYRDHDLNGSMSFLQGLVQSLKILILGGVVAVCAGIIYINYVEATHNTRDFSGRLFGALLIGVISAFGATLVLMTNTSKID